MRGPTSLSLDSRSLRASVCRSKVILPGPSPASNGARDDRCSRPFRPAEWGPDHGLTGTITSALHRPHSKSTKTAEIFHGQVTSVLGIISWRSRPMLWQRCRTTWNTTEYRPVVRYNVRQITGLELPVTQYLRPRRPPHTGAERTMMNRDCRRTNGWYLRLRAAKVGEVSVRSLAALSLTVALPSGKARKAVPIIVLLALAAALALFLQADRNAAQAQSSNPSLVPVNWSLNPDDLGAGDKFRLLFLSSTKTDAMSTDIEDYNTFIKNLVAAGHADLDTYSEGFRVVGCTADVDARDNTGTNTNTDGAGVPIYWLNGSRVADDNADSTTGTGSTRPTTRTSQATTAPIPTSPTTAPSPAAATTARSLVPVARRGRSARLLCASAVPTTPLPTTALSAPTLPPAAPTRVRCTGSRRSSRWRRRQALGRCWCRRSVCR